jgi:ATP-dependent Zn protease
VKTILSDKKDLLGGIARILLEKETMEGEELRTLIKGYERENE